MTRKRGKKYVEAAKLVDPNKLYPPEEGIELAKKSSYTSFDGTVEVHLRMGVDPRHADQQVRGVASLPNGLGKKVRVLVFAQGDAARTAETAGADVVGSDDLVKQIEGGFLDFDIAIATPDQMGKVGRLGKILGRRGLMPNPKSGTVVQPQDIARAVNDARKGRVEFRLDRTALMHVPIGTDPHPVSNTQSASVVHGNAKIEQYFCAQVPVPIVHDAPFGQMPTCGSHPGSP